MLLAKERTDRTAAAKAVDSLAAQLAEEILKAEARTAEQRAALSKASLANIENPAATALEDELAMLRSALAARQESAADARHRVAEVRLGLAIDAARIATAEVAASSAAAELGAVHQRLADAGARPNHGNMGPLLTTAGGAGTDPNQSHSPTPGRRDAPQLAEPGDEAGSAGAARGAAAATSIQAGFRGHRDRSELRRQREREDGERRRQWAEAEAAAAATTIQAGFQGHQTRNQIQQQRHHHHDKLQQQPPGGEQRIPVAGAGSGHGGAPGARQAGANEDAHATVVDAATTAPPASDKLLPHPESVGAQPAAAELVLHEAAGEEEDARGDAHRGDGTGDGLGGAGPQLGDEGGADPAEAVRSAGPSASSTGPGTGSAAGSSSGPAADAGGDTADAGGDTDDAGGALRVSDSVRDARGGVKEQWSLEKRAVSFWPAS